MAKSSDGRTLDAMPDTVDFRDRVYDPTLVEVLPRRLLGSYHAVEVPVLDQGAEGACTGFALATVANYLLRRRSVDPDTVEVSARMFYEMAKRYDEWPGEDYEGSSARGAIKGWHKHGVCARELWNDAQGVAHLGVTEERASDAMKRPLGAYYRVNHLDLVSMHSAISEVGILFATARVHDGWSMVGEHGLVPYDPAVVIAGGHAFAIVGYDEDGFWFQNSWGRDWGAKGFGHVRYDDWLANGMDVWVARLGAPARLGGPGATASMRAGAPRAYESYVYCALRPHVITVGNDGTLRPTGTYGLEPDGLRHILRGDLATRIEGWKRKRVVVYAHGGLVDEDSAIQRIADYRETMMAAELYPLCFVWRSDLWTTVGNVISDAVVTRTEGVFDAARNFLLDRIDDTIEPVARNAGGKAVWDEMKENAQRATTTREGAARLLAQELASLVEAGKVDEIHLVGHSAGAIFLGPFAQLLAGQPRGENGRATRKQGLGISIASCTLWAPACTTSFFSETYRPLIESERISRFSLYTLTDATEQDDDCRGIYHKSLLYLVRNAFEETPRIAIDDTRYPGTPLLGLERDIRNDEELLAFVKSHDWVLAPDAASGGRSRSEARHHGAFDDDPVTLRATLASIIGVGRSEIEPEFTVRSTQREQGQEAARLERRRALVMGLRRR